MGIAESRVKLLRFECKSCGVTHAIIPGNLIPYSPYNLSFKLIVLIAYFERTTTVVALCANYGIAVSTLYAWKHRLLEHKDLALGALLSMKTLAVDFLRGFFDSVQISDRLSGFFKRFGFSFMQNRCAPATRSTPP
jgi:transposase